MRRAWHVDLRAHVTLFTLFLCTLFPLINQRCVCHFFFYLQLLYKAVRLHDYSCVTVVHTFFPRTDACLASLLTMCNSFCPSLRLYLSKC